MFLALRSGHGSVPALLLVPALFAGALLGAGLLLYWWRNRGRRRRTRKIFLAAGEL